MAGTYNEALAQAARKRIEAAVEEIKEQIAAGTAPDTEYRRKAGEIAGLRLALDLIDQANTDLMRR